MTRGPLLYNRVSVNEWARVGLRDGWSDLGTGRKDQSAATQEGRVIARTAHRMSLGVGAGIILVLRRVDITSIEVDLGKSKVN